MKRRSRTLSAEDKALWTHVARSVKPLEPSRLAGLDAPAPAEDLAPPRPVKPVPAPPPEPRRPPAPPPLAPIEKGLRRKLNRGAAEAEARLDLHGLTQEVAHRRLIGFLRRAQGDGLKLVIVITGKGGPKGPPRMTPSHEEPWHSDPHADRGVLRRVVPQWLRLPDFRDLVIGFEEAAIGHGGAGALYVRIRRPRAP